MSEVPLSWQKDGSSGSRQHSHRQKNNRYHVSGAHRVPKLSKHFRCIHSFDLHNNPMRKAPLSFHYAAEEHEAERSSNSLTITHLIRGRVMLLTLILEPPLLMAQLLCHRQHPRKESWGRACPKLALSPLIREKCFPEAPADFPFCLIVQNRVTCLPQPNHSGGEWEHI